MNITAWILLCLFASIGLVQAVGWVLCRFARPKGHIPGFYIVPLSADTDDLEMQLRYELRLRRWSGIPEPNLVLLDPGLDCEGRFICEQLIRDDCGVALCTPEELAREIAGAGDLQTDFDKL